ncbi:MAG: hypothetical protein GY938_25630 [Ketobacter sp.]|nr:hypothetical protein [Ketobacter sp.]
MGQSEQGLVHDAPVAYLSVGISREKILGEFDGWSTVKDDIEKMEEVIDINLHLNAMVQSLKIINEKHSQDEARKRIASARLILNTLQQIDYEPTQGHPVIFEIEPREDQNEDKQPKLKSSFRLPYELAVAIVHDKFDNLQGNFEVIRFVEEVPLNISIIA